MPDDATTNVIGSPSSTLFDNKKKDLGIFNCEDVDKEWENVEKTVSGLFEILSDKEKFNNALNQIRTSTREYIIDVANTNNQARYKQGRLAVDIALMFVGVGELKAVASGTKLGDAMAQMASKIEKCFALLPKLSRNVSRVDRIFFKKTDNFIDIVMHKVNNGYEAIVEAGQTTKKISATELAKYMDEYDGQGTFRLLTCNSGDDAVELSKLTKRKFYASDGAVDLYPDGTIRSENPFHLYENGTVKKDGVISHAPLEEEAKIAKLAEEEKPVRLGDGIAKGADWATIFPKLASKLDSWKSLELVFEKSDDFVRVLSKNGDEVARVVKNGTDEILEVSDELFTATGTNPIKIEGISVETSSGDNVINGGFVKNSNGSISFVEDVSSYGSTIIQNTLKARADLRGTISGITKSQEAHHLFPVDLLKKNQWVKKGVEGGFEFNLGSINGMPVEKYVKSTGIGRHGPHPQLTSQIDKHMEWWAEQTVNGVKNKNLTPAQTADYMRGLANSLKNKINSSTVKLNDLNLNLPH